MTIAVGATNLNLDAPSGLNRYTHGVITELLAADRDFVMYTTEQLGAIGGKRVRQVSPDFLRKGDFVGNLSRLVWSQTSLPRRVRQDRATVFYSPVPEGMIAPPCPQVITIHDLLPLRFPADSPRLRYYYQFVLPTIVRASQAIIVDSESTRRDVESMLPVGDRPVHVAYPGLQEGFIAPPEAGARDRVQRIFGISDYVLAVGEARPYKNVRRLISAFSKLTDTSTQLAIVGKLSRTDQEITELPRQLGIQDRVKFLGMVTDSDLKALYGGARLFVFPSLYEGFGIPPLEAMGCGCPVVASNSSSIPEVCGDAALFVDPTDEDDIATGISRVLSDCELAETLRQRGRERVGHFRYQNTAGKVLEVLDSVAQGRNQSRALRSPEPV